jgi:hypothetical protein
MSDIFIPDVCERDIDLLLLEEAIASAPFDGQQSQQPCDAWSSRWTWLTTCSPLERPQQGITAAANLLAWYSATARVLIAQDEVTRISAGIKQTNE